MITDPGAITITRKQVRETRRLLNWTRVQLAVQAGIGMPVLAYFERGGPRPQDVVLKKLRAALEAAGVEFVAENGGGAGVRLKRPARPAIPVADLNASNDE